MLISSSPTAQISEAMSLWTRLVSEEKKGAPKWNSPWAEGVGRDVYLSRWLGVRNGTWELGFGCFWKRLWLRLYAFRTQHLDLFVQFQETISEQNERTKGAITMEQEPMDTFVACAETWTSSAMNINKQSSQVNKHPGLSLAAISQAVRSHIYHLEEKVTLFELKQFLEFFLNNF